MGFHPNDKRSLVIRSKTHTTFFIFLLDKVSVLYCVQLETKILSFRYENWISLCDVRRIYANINSFLLYN